MYLTWSIVHLIAIIAFVIIAALVHIHVGFNENKEWTILKKDKKRNKKNTWGLAAIAILLILIAAFDTGMKQSDINRTRYDNTAIHTDIKRVEVQSPTAESIKQKFEQQMKEAQENQ